MSLESARKLGLTASTIAVIVPVVSAVLSVFLLFSFFLSLAATIANGTPPATVFSPFSLGLLYAAFIALGILSFAGFILFLVSMHRLSKYYGEPDIFRKILHGFLISTLTAIAVAVVFLVLFFVTRTFASVTPPVTGVSVVFGLMLSFLVMFAVVFVAGIVGAVFYMRGFNLLAEKSGINNFHNAGLLYLIGVATSVVLVGSFIVWIAWIFALLGFRALPPKPAPIAPPPDFSTAPQNGGA